MMDMAELSSVIVAQKSVELSDYLVGCYNSKYVTKDDIRRICNMIADDAIKKIEEETKS